MLLRLMNDIEVDSNRLVHAPPRPGLSHEIDWELIERNKNGRAALTDARS